MMVAVLLTVTGGGLCLGSAAIARHRAQAAADLAALAAAVRVPAGADAACGQAVLVAHRMRTRYVDCRVDALDVTVVVEMPVVFPGPGPLPGVSPARATARAGPA